MKKIEIVINKTDVIAKTNWEAEPSETFLNKYQEINTKFPEVKLYVEKSITPKLETIEMVINSWDNGSEWANKLGKGLVRSLQFALQSQRLF